MVLEITNIGKIQKAALELRGLTVIAGNNNTGKSTYGKTLYCMFNAFFQAESAIAKERKQNLKNIIIGSLQVIRFLHRIDNLVNNIMDHRSSKEEIQNLLQEAIRDKIVISKFNPEDDAVSTTTESIIRSAKVTDEQIQKTILTRFLRSEFGNQIIHVNRAEETGVISLTIKGKTLSAQIKNNECTSFTDRVGITYQAIYIDTPFILDDIDNFAVYSESGHRDRLLGSLAKSFNGIDAVDEILTKERLRRVQSAIRGVINGEFSHDKDSWMFQEEGLNNPLSMLNISAGMKPFLILKRLLEAGEIKEQGVLVFDEPEIHLHPEWQLKYAELLVLLQKEFNLNILLTTHSPYFLNAIEVYSQKHNTSNCCNYYVTDTQGDSCGITEVTDNLNGIYKKMASPFQELENLRYGED
jgi:predicted ATPase